VKVGAQVRTLLEGNFLDQKENLLASGIRERQESLTVRAGAGTAGEERRQMRFTTCALLVQTADRQRELRLSREIKRLARYDGLLIDDLGYVSKAGGDGSAIHAAGRSATSEAAC